MTIIIEYSWHFDIDRLAQLINGFGPRVALSHVNSWLWRPVEVSYGTVLFVLSKANLTSLIESHGPAPLLCMLTSDDTHVYVSAVDIWRDVWVRENSY